MFPKQVTIVEVGPRDGFQNEPTALSATQKIELINDLASCGLKIIEAGSFVSPKWIPQMADTREVLQALDKSGPLRYPVLVPNLRGLEEAIEAGCQDVAVFASASESFSLRNINCTIAESLERYESVIKAALDAKLRVRGYVSCVLGCPYEGEIDFTAVTQVASALFQMGCFEVSLGDTIGVGTPEKAKNMLSTVAEKIPLGQLAVHFHDTYGQALANIYACLLLGISTIDSSIGGLGGCPYAPGASGNVATEDVVYLLNGLNIEHGIDLKALVHVSHKLAALFNRPPRSKVAQAMGDAQ